MFCVGWSIVRATDDVEPTPGHPIITIIKHLETSGEHIGFIKVTKTTVDVSYIDPQEVAQQIQSIRDRKAAIAADMDRQVDDLNATLIIPVPDEN